MKIATNNPNFTLENHGETREVKGYLYSRDGWSKFSLQFRDQAYFIGFGGP